MGNQSRLSARPMGLLLLAFATLAVAGGPIAQPVPPEPSPVPQARKPDADTARRALGAMCGFLGPAATIQSGGPTTCRDNSDCRSTVHVTRQNKAGAPSCIANWQSTQYVIRKDAKPALIWTLRSIDTLPGAPSYAFLEPSSDDTIGGGVALCRQSKNDRKLDLDGEKCVDASCQAYSWQVIHGRDRPRNDRKLPHDASGRPPHAAIHFGLQVYRTDTGEICESRDPVIIIRGD
jgi:hypothetical protein